MSDKKEKTLNAGYHLGRKNKYVLKYRLRRRSSEISGLIKKYYNKEIEQLLDLGTADGLMLDILNSAHSINKCIGLDLSIDLLKHCQKSWNPVYANACYVPIKDNCIDVIVCTAVLEHVSNPAQLFKECYRLLSPGGIMALTVPDPFWSNFSENINAHLAAIFGITDQDQHNSVPGIPKICAYAKEAGFAVLETRKFMLSPVGFPFEIQIEHILHTLHLDFWFFNQSAVLKKAIV